MNRFEKLYPAVFTLLFSAMLLLPARSALTGSFASTTSGQTLIAAYNDFRLALGDKVFPNVLVGRDGWLFYTGEQSDDDYQNTYPFKQRQIIAITEGLNRLDARLRARGAKLIVVIAPNKATIYPEYMPAEIQRLDDQSRLDRLSAYLQQHSDVTFLDLRAVLLEAKKGERIYYQTDTHWNDLGGYAAYGQILAALGIPAHPRSDYVVEQTAPQILDLAANIGAESLREPKINLAPRFDIAGSFESTDLGENRRLQTWSSPDQSLPTAVMYHDSFAFNLIPMLAPHFQRAVFVPHFSGPNWTLDWVDKEKPDVVIIEFAERYLAELEKLLER
jgi:hypothetical protein